ncbi:antigen 5 like allergen Cul n 1 [Drosophila busckii]|uniref:antigen 5 like allergen Cul n 1 n=1 Tax=Drosophila busckii TaxID=30019 RepID=UPI00083F1370|nr:antigen 5 like allergen Cul n 1 [Drosophila busckii]
MSRFMLIALLVLVQLLQLALAKQHSWCDASLCAGVKHIACRNNGHFHKRCQPDAFEVEISARNKAHFVHGHNKRRNFVALGKLPGYYPAARMTTMMWDDELQYLASLNVRTCKLDHDACHNSYRFANSGQNLCAVWRNRNPHVNVTSLIEESLGLWFNEYDLIDSSYIDRFRVTKHFEEYGHFVEMVVDKSAKIGCAILRFTRPDHTYGYVYNVVCNYSSIYALDAPVYEVGRTASRCQTGRNPLYPGLCSTREHYDPNW